MMSDRNRESSKAGYVYVLSNEAMPGIVKIGMTLRHPDLRLKEINAATGVLPFEIEAVIASRNARWTEREVHERLADKRISSRREFFRVEPSEAKRVILDVARVQRQKAFSRHQWSGKGTFAGRAAMSFGMVPIVALFDLRLVPVWVAACICALTVGRPAFVREFQHLSSQIPTTLLVLSCLTSLAWCLWLAGGPLLTEIGAFIAQQIARAAAAYLS